MTPYTCKKALTIGFILSKRAGGSFIKNSESPSVIHSAVSYTHLDVYKRQGMGTKNIENRVQSLNGTISYQPQLLGLKVEIYFSKF